MPKDPLKQRQFQREWKAARRAEWIAEHGPCACGSDEDLEIDHIDPVSKLMNPGRVWSFSEARRETELAKCQVLCGPCHREKTRAWRRAHLRHGDYGMYRTGCRCAPCRRANAAAERKRRASGPEL